MSTETFALTWSASQLGEAIEVLARSNGCDAGRAQIPYDSGNAFLPNHALEQWVQDTAQWYGLEAEQVEVTYDAVDEMLQQTGPALLKLPENSKENGKPQFLVLLGDGKPVSVLASNLSTRKVAPGWVRSRLVESLEEPLSREVEPLIILAGIPAKRRDRARAALIRERLRNKSVTSFWKLRTPPGASFADQVIEAKIPSRFVALIGAYLGEYALWILSWWLIGKGALEGTFDSGWLLAWALLLLTIVPFRLLSTWLQGVVSIGVAALLKRRLLYGALRLTTEEIRVQGVGQFLSRVLESEAVEAMALSGGFSALISVIELLAAFFVLSWGSAGSLLCLLLAAWILLTSYFGYDFYVRRKTWTAARLHMTHDLIERMVGHRTRLAQESHAHWHDGEDEELDRYLRLSKNVDRSELRLLALAPRGWLIVALLGIAPTFSSGSNSPEQLAIAIGGILIASRAFKRAANSLWQLEDAAISWKQVAPLFHAAARPEPVGIPMLRSVREPKADSLNLVEAQDLTFRYQDRGEPVLRKCSFSIRAQDRILLQGHSGDGKSTLASLLIGMRTPQSGLLLLDGLDWQTLGTDGWRRRVVSAPQFHENHVLTETFAFNLLMGRGWPPTQKDMEEAEEICRELGLGDLLDRMPAGLLQMVGETGWQLSHGERSRLYIARALLQRASMIILDESFAALDPETLRRSLQCVLKRAPALMVIAHP
jgi:ABC-type multidrug transport system fused ATPase/permease subunit